MNINHVLEQFKFKGKLESCDIFGSGHINTTFLATYNEDGKKRNYVIQKVNTSIFPDIDALMNNIFSVTDFLREKIKADGGNPHRETLHFIRTLTEINILKTRTVLAFVRIVLLTIQRHMIRLTAQKFLAKAVRHLADFKSI